MAMKNEPNARMGGGFEGGGFEDQGIRPFTGAEDFASGAIGCAMLKNWSPIQTYVGKPLRFDRQPESCG